VRLDRGETASQPWPRIARGFCLTTDDRGTGIHLPALPPPPPPPPLFPLPCPRPYYLPRSFSLSSPRLSLFTTVGGGVNCPVAADISLPLNPRHRGSRDGARARGRAVRNCPMRNGRSRPDRYRYARRDTFETARNRTRLSLSID